MLPLIVAVLLALAPASAAAAEPQALKSPNVEWIAEIPSPDGVSAAFEGSHMYLSTFRGLEVYDIGDPTAPQKVGELSLPLFQNEDVSTNGEILLISRDSILGLSRLYVVDVTDPAAPSILSTLDTSDFKAPLGSIGHTATCIDDCRYAWLAGWSKGIDMVDLRDPRAPRFASPRKLRTPYAACDGPGHRAMCDGTHDVQVDSSGLAWVAGIGGTVAYDISDPTKPVRRFRTNKRGRSRLLEGGDIPPDGSTYNDFIHHNSLRRGNTLLVTEEDFRPGCKHPGSVQTWRIGADGIVRPLDKWEVERDPARATYCSAHYFDERDGLLAQGWYEAGARFIDWSKPRKLRQTGFWIPFRGNVTNAYWAPTDPDGEIVYAFDEQRGVDILRLDRDAPPMNARPRRQAKSSGLAARPDARVALDNGVERVAPGRVVRYFVGIQNTRRGKRSRAARAVVELGAGLSFASDGSQRREVGFPALTGGGNARRVLRVQVAGDAPKWVEASVVLLATDGDPANDFSVHRDPTRKGVEPAARSARLFCMLGRR